MKTFGSVIKKVAGLQFMFEKLKLSSVLGRNALLRLPYIKETEKLLFIFDCISRMTKIMHSEKGKKSIEKICLKLEQLNDIHGTVKNLQEGFILDDVQLFEIKKFALLSEEIRELLARISFSFIEISDLNKIIQILDPQQQKISHFFIYSEYDSELLRLRSAFERAYTNHPEEAEKLRIQVTEREDLVREKLTQELSGFHTNLLNGLNSLAEIDIIIAKTYLASDFGLCRPTISSKETSYKNLFNPYIQELLHNNNKSYQAIDIAFDKQPNLITGINMGGKTVFLKTIQLSQYLFQFGFFVPATQAQIMMVHDILSSLTEQPAESGGLSSFASEMLIISEMVKASKAEKNVLLLIDELARTTNPQEGRAIVNAVLDILVENKTSAFITTHYSDIQSSCRKLRVKGLITEKLGENTTVQNINECIDYSLIELAENNAPMEALAIARILKIDEDIIKHAEKYQQKLNN
jgi:DNA mismatch repair ATPase MutS